MTTGFELHASFASFVNFAGVGTPTRPQSVHSDSGLFPFTGSHAELAKHLA